MNVFATYLYPLILSFVFYCLANKYTKNYARKQNLEPILELIDDCLEIQKLSDDEIYKELKNYLKIFNDIQQKMDNLNRAQKEKFNYNKDKWNEVKKLPAICFDDYQEKMNVKRSIIEVLLTLKSEIEKELK